MSVEQMAHQHHQSATAVIEIDIRTDFDVVGLYIYRHVTEMKKAVEYWSGRWFQFERCATVVVAATVPGQVADHKDGTSQSLEYIGLRVSTSVAYGGS